MFSQGRPQANPQPHLIAPVHPQHQRQPAAVAIPIGGACRDLNCNYGHVSRADALEDSAKYSILAGGIDFIVTLFISCIAKLVLDTTTVTSDKILTWGKFTGAIAGGAFIAYVLGSIAILINGFLNKCQHWKYQFHKDQLDHLVTKHDPTYSRRITAVENLLTPTALVLVFVPVIGYAIGLRGDEFRQLLTIIGADSAALLVILDGGVIANKVYNWTHTPSTPPTNQTITAPGSLALTFPPLHSVPNVAAIEHRQITNPTASPAGVPHSALQTSYYISATATTGQPQQASGEIQNGQNSGPGFPPW